ncbi:phosphatase PAP2 family protein [Metabacillus crassostreae]|uniref:phosphatase PAP2 family protein n=1 Tax=Metabacillus crassostreae TaxID=929098 RepID=UPI001EF90494|nr:phosphatase PAP2 family protein [Metabacillus crassostreae]
MKRIAVVLILVILFSTLVILTKLESMIRLERKIGESIYAFSEMTLFNVIHWVGMLASTGGIVAILFISMIFFIIRGKKFIAAVMLFTSVLVGNILNKLVKAIIARDRPSFTGHLEEGYSFPSGHVMVGVILYGLIAYYLIQSNITVLKKKWTILFTCILLFLIGFSRLLEGEHYFTDVIGGYLAGGTLLVVLISIDHFIHSRFIIGKEKTIQYKA